MKLKNIDFLNMLTMQRTVLNTFAGVTAVVCVNHIMQLGLMVHRDCSANDTGRFEIAF